MQNISNILKNTALALVAAVFATGCIFEKMDMPEDLQSVLIQVNVSTDDMLTKADPTASESTVNTLHIYAFHNGNFAGYCERGATVVNEPFLMDLTIPEGASVPVEFYAVANASSMMDYSSSMQLTENMTKQQLESLRFTGILSGSPLPLYCKTTQNLNTTEYINSQYEGHEGHIQLINKVDFELSRSLAKISVYGAKPAEVTTSPKILSVTMLAAGTREYSYLFEQNDDKLDLVESRVNDRIFLEEKDAVTLGVLSGASDLAESYTPVVTKPTYLPEVSFGSSDWANQVHERQVVLKVEYTLSAEGARKTGFVYMPRIERNRHYKVCILVSEQEDGRIIVNYQVADWNDHEIPDFEFKYPTHSYMRDFVPNSEADLATKPSARAQMSENTPFTGYFQTDEAFTPALVGNYASDADVRVYKLTGEEITDRPVPASDKWYRITVTPHTDFPVGETVNLAVTYKPGLVDSHEFLLINGTAGNFYWPESTDANYVTITMVN